MLLTDWYKKVIKSWDAVTVGGLAVDLRMRAINGQWILIGINNHILILMGINVD